MDPYRTIADLYDCEHGEFTDDIELYLHLLTRGPILEIGAGTGRITHALARAGIEVWAVEPSSAMSNRGRQKGHRTVHWIEESVLDLNLGRFFPASLLPLNTLWHLPDRDEQERALTVIRRHLAPDGLLVIDCNNPVTLADRGAQGTVRERFHGTCDGLPLTITSAAWDDEAEQILDLHLTYDVIDASSMLRRFETNLCFRYLYRAELELLLRLTGFTVHQTYGSYDLEPFGPDSANLLVVAGAADSGIV